MPVKQIVIFISVMLFTAAAVGAQTPVVVTNRAGDAVPVKVTNDPAKRSYQLGVDLAFPPSTEPPTVPMGQTFVVQYVSARYRTFNAFGAKPCNAVELYYGFTPEAGIVPEPYAFKADLLGTGQGISGDVNFFTIAQPVTIYIGGGTSLAPNLTLGSTCSPPYIQGRMVFSGYLVKSN